MRAVFARRDDDARSFTCAVAATLALSPIVWLHYLVVLLVPMAILRPRFSVLWLLPVLLWVSPRPGYAEGVPTFDARARGRDHGGRAACSAALGRRGREGSGVTAGTAALRQRSGPLGWEWHASARAARRGCRRIANGPLHRVRVGRSGQARAGTFAPPTSRPAELVADGRLAVSRGSQRSEPGGVRPLHLPAAARARADPAHACFRRRRRRDRRPRIARRAHGCACRARRSRRPLLCGHRHLGAGLERPRDGQRVGVVRPARRRAWRFRDGSVPTRGGARRDGVGKALPLAVARVGAATRRAGAARARSALLGRRDSGLVGAHRVRTAHGYPEFSREITRQASYSIEDGAVSPGTRLGRELVGRGLAARYSAWSSRSRGTTTWSGVLRRDRSGARVEPDRLAALPRAARGSARDRTTALLAALAAADSAVGVPALGERRRPRDVPAGGGGGDRARCSSFVRVATHDGGWRCDRRLARGDLAAAAAALTERVKWYASIVFCGVAARGRADRLLRDDDCRRDARVRLSPVLSSRRRDPRRSVAVPGGGRSADRGDRAVRLSAARGPGLDPVSGRLLRRRGRRAHDPANRRCGRDPVRARRARLALLRRRLPLAARLERHPDRQHDPLPRSCRGARLALRDVRSAVGGSSA